MQHSSQIITTNFLQAGCPSCYPANNVKALKGKGYVLCVELNGRLALEDIVAILQVNCNIFNRL